MLITHHETEEIRQLTEANELNFLENISGAEFDLYSSIELACCRFIGNKRHEALFPILDGWASESPMLTCALETIMMGRIPHRSDIFTPRPWEFFPILSAAWNDNDHHLFESRFTAAVREAGFGKKATALAGAFFEMADNITQHSGSSSAHPARGILGYQVERDCMTFAVGDVGRGVLASLTENLAWKHLEDSADALEAAVRKNASRRTGLGEGNGFRQVFKSLADMNGYLVFRSGDGVLTIEGQPDKRQGTKASSTSMAGLQLAVTCCVK